MTNEEASIAQCLNCDAVLHGKFCSNCGQKVVEPSERTFKHFVFQFLGSAFFLENNFLKNLWVLLIKPGQQSMDYIEGRRKRWMAPLSIFLLINLIYFFINPISDFSLSLSDQLNYQLHSNVVLPWVNERLDNRQVSFSEYAIEYKRQSETLAKTIMIINVPISALFFMLWFYKKRILFIDHFVFFIYLYAWLLLIAIAINFVFQVLIWIGIVIKGTSAGPIILLIFLTIYLGVAIKEVYKQRKLLPLVASVLFSFIALAGTHLVYRFILFVLTFWTT
jgi:hypothetical protein